jgi:Holliday junction resolvase
MTTPEKKVKDTVKKMLDTYGAYYFMPATGGYGRSGVPDIVGTYKGRFFAVECKAKDNKPTELQMREIKKILDAGGYAVIVNENTYHKIKLMMELIDDDCQKTAEED